MKKSLTVKQKNTLSRITIDRRLKPSNESNDGTRITLTNARNVSPSASLQDMQTSSKPSVHIPGIVVMRTPHGK